MTVGNETHTAAGRSQTEAVTDATRILWQFACPVLLFLGTTCNVLAIVCLRRMRRRHQSGFHEFLMAIAICDLAALYVGLVHRWIDSQFGVHIVDSNVVLCKLQQWLGYSLGMLSVWLLTAMVIQRAMYEYKPSLRARWGNTQKQTHVIIAVLTFSVFTLHSYIFVEKTIVVTHSGTKCESYSESFKRTALSFMNWFNGLFYSIVPSIVMAIADCFLVMAVNSEHSVGALLNERTLMRGNKVQHVSSFSSFTTDYMVATQPCLSQADRFAAEAGGGAGDGGLSRVMSEDARRWRTESAVRHVHSQTTLSLITVTLLFILLTQPLSVINIQTDLDPQMKKQPKYRFYKAIALLAMYASHTMKFYVLFLTGSVFDKELTKLLESSNNKTDNVALKDYRNQAVRVQGKTSTTKRP